MNKDKDCTCPRCDSKENVISDGISGHVGTVGVRGYTDSNDFTLEGMMDSSYYCTSCFCEFTIRVIYRQLSKSKFDGISGNTGFTG
jgi:nitrate reductase cytochrome c-type subunit